MVATRTHFLRCAELRTELQDVTSKINELRIRLSHPFLRRRLWMQKHLRRSLENMRFKAERTCARFHTYYGRLMRRNNICVKSRAELKQIIAIKNLGWPGVIKIAATARDLDRLRRRVREADITIVRGYLR
ncbi:hypothetical protein F3Y22_tig00110187pilonHSYRG00095 [Hibiscus syriacus]|uniref:Uncharacterized protein n=1 Tax=Hibiscus syriacus TaxID=106335 RepID=A0A6A3BFF9_HIBSY|nr:hypothetical protein F3Y22_tig00110187pilonHSYRG00095 [Hibiscus syriacus]